MKRFPAAWVIIALLAPAGISANTFSKGDSLFTLSLKNVKSGKPDHLQKPTKQKLFAVIFLSPECPICKNYSLTLNHLAEKYKNEVSFAAIIPGKSYSISDTRDFVSKYKIAFNIYLDPSLSTAKLLRAETTPEVFLIDSAQQVIYSGAIDNWFRQLGVNAPKATEFYLQNAIDNMLANRIITEKYKKPVGCSINDY